MFNFVVVSEEGNVMVSGFWCSHENEGCVCFGGVGERDDFWILGKLNGCGI